VTLRNRIFDLVFRGRGRKRAEERRDPARRKTKRTRDAPEPDGFDVRYFVRRRR